MSDKASVAKMLLGEDATSWCLISATEDERESLGAYLRDKGYQHLSVDGYWYGNRESSFLVFDMNTDDAISLADLFFQDAVLTSRGLFYKRFSTGWWVQQGFSHRHVVFEAIPDGVLDRSIVHCSDGPLTLFCLC